MTTSRGREIYGALDEEIDLDTILSEPPPKVYYSYCTAGVHAPASDPMLMKSNVNSKTLKMCTCAAAGLRPTVSI